MAGGGGMLSGKFGGKLPKQMPKSKPPKTQNPQPKPPKGPKGPKPQGNPRPFPNEPFHDASRWASGAMPFFPRLDFSGGGGNGGGGGGWNGGGGGGPLAVPYEQVGPDLMQKILELFQACADGVLTDSTANMMFGRSLNTPPSRDKAGNIDATATNVGTICAALSKRASGEPAKKDSGSRQNQAMQVLQRAQDDALFEDWIDKSYQQLWDRKASQQLEESWASTQGHDRKASQHSTRE